MEYNYKVYAHINKTNGKIYVGVTRQELKKRWGSDGNGYKDSRYFYRAIQKYGWDNFEHEIIAENITKHEAKNFEILLISELNTTNRDYGYNISKGGDGIHGHTHSEETRKRMSESRKNSSFKLEYTEEIRKNLSKAKSGKNNPMYGKEVPYERLKKKFKKVYQYDLDGNFIKEWESISIAAKTLNIKSVNIIASCNKGLSCHGFIWKYDSYNKIPCFVNKRAKSVIQYDLEQNIICEFKSIRKASKNTGCNSKGIIDCCKNKRESYKGFVWKYKNI